MLDLTGYRLTFADEFNQRSISQTGAGTTWSDIRREWRFDANSDIGFGHASFVDSASGYDPFDVAGGALTITAVPDRTRFGDPGSWESGLITTQGDFSQTYGYFEMRADLADEVGGWDAFWLLPNQPAGNTGNLPGWQELDVVEHYGNYDQGTYRWIHTTDPAPNQNPNRDLQVFSDNPTQLSGYHTYGMNWQQDRIGFYFDGQFMGSQATPSDMHGPMYLLANLATQGEGSNDADAAGVPIIMRIDYVRAYSNDPNATAVPLDTISAPDGLDPGTYGAVSRATDIGGPPSGMGATLLDDNIIGTELIDVISLLAGNDIYSGLSGSDIIYGNSGNDLLFGNQGDDVIFGGQGIDTIYGGQNSDRIYGNLGADIIYGNQGTDEIFGGQGNDVLHGGQGNDVLAGNLGDDLLIGGLGADLFVFALMSGHDRVTGFDQGAGDRLSLSGQTCAIGTSTDGDALLALSGGGFIELDGVLAAQVNDRFFN